MKRDAVLGRVSGFGEDGERALPVVSAKLTPPRVEDSDVRRPRLDALLSRATEKAVTLVCAGPGSGKSRAVAGWLAAGTTDRAVAWLTLDETDNDVPTFWLDVLAALNASDALRPGNPLRDMVPAGRFGAAEIRRVQAGLEGLTGPLVFVFDDLDEVTNREVLDGLSRLVERPGPTLGLVLITRAEPPLRLQRLRVGGRLCEIRAADLAFDLREAGELFARSGLTLSSPQVRTLLERTAGWAAGLRLAAMSLDRDDLDASITEFSGDGRAVTEYLAGEVLDRKPPALRDFLVRTSVTDRISGSLADALTGRADGRLTLDQLAGDDAIVVGVDRHREWVRYHPLLRQTLVHRLGVEHPAAVPDLHRRAAIWFAEHGEPIEAVRHAALADDAHLLGHTLLNLALPRLMSPDARQLVAAIGPAAAHAANHPTLVGLVCAVAAHHYRHDYAAVGRDIRCARELLDTAHPALREPAEIVLTLFETARARLAGRAAMTVAGARRALGLLDRGPADLAATPHYRIIALSNLGVGLLWSGELEEAAGCLHAVESGAAPLHLQLPQVNALAHLALIDAMTGALDQGAERAEAALRLAERFAWTSEPEVASAHLTLALVHLQRVELPDAARHLRQALAGNGQSGQAARLAAQTIQTRLLLTEGHVARAVNATTRLREQMARSGAASALLDKWVADAEADALLLAGRPEEVIDSTGAGDVHVARAMLALGLVGKAEALVQPIIEDSDGDLERAVEARLVLVQAAEQRRLDGAAVEALADALALAEPQRMSRPFLILGDRLAALLKQQQELVERSGDFVARLIAQLDLDAGPPVPPLAEPLTDRELSVLRYLPTMRSNTEIGRDLYVTVNTVKAHLKALYRKLEVANRREAVVRARDLGLI
jgi:LuxR family maltose regulon positive regulatory protein